MYYNADANINDVVENDASKDTALTAWFKINQTNPQARDTTHQNFPCTWVYKSKVKKWKPRQKGYAISHMYFASPSSGERFYLWLLLTVVVGATSFAHLHTVNGIQFDTNKEAWFALGLLEDDQKWNLCDYVFRKLAKCRQDMLYRCSLPPFSSIAIQLVLPKFSSVWFSPHFLRTEN